MVAAKADCKGWVQGLNARAEQWRHRLYNRCVLARAVFDHSASSKYDFILAFCTLGSAKLSFMPHRTSRVRLPFVVRPSAAQPVLYAAKAQGQRSFKPLVVALACAFAAYAAHAQSVQAAAPSAAQTGLSTHPASPGLKVAQYAKQANLLLPTTIQADRIDGSPSSTLNIEGKVLIEALDHG